MSQRLPICFADGGGLSGSDVNLVLGFPTDGKTTAVGLEIRGTIVRFARPVEVESIFDATAQLTTTSGGGGSAARAQLALPASPEPAAGAQASSTIANLSTLNATASKSEENGGENDGLRGGNQGGLYDVEAVVGKKKEKGRLFYAVKWVNYEDPTWEPASNLKGIMAVKEFEAGQKRVTSGAKGPVKKAQRNKKTPSQKTPTKKTPNKQPPVEARVTRTKSAVLPREQ